MNKTLGTCSVDELKRFAEVAPKEWGAYQSENGTLWMRPILGTEFAFMVGQGPPASKHHQFTGWALVWLAEHGLLPQLVPPGGWNGENWCVNGTMGATPVEAAFRKVLEVLERSREG